MSVCTSILAPFPVKPAFLHIQWDPLVSLRLTAQENALLRMSETNPTEYTLTDSRDASMYTLICLKLLAAVATAGGRTGDVSGITEPCTETQAIEALGTNPLRVVTHYALTKFHSFITTLMSGTG